MENEATATWLAKQAESSIFPSQINDVTFGERVIVRPFCNLYGCTIGDETTIGAYTEIGRGVTVGKRCKIGAYVFIPPGITIEDDVFIGPRVTFTNDRYPSAKSKWGEWKLEKTRIKAGASIGAGVVVLPGLYVGEGALIGAGMVLTDSVMPGWRVYNAVNLAGKSPAVLEDAERGTGK